LAYNAIVREELNGGNVMVTPDQGSSPSRRYTEYVLCLFFAFIFLASFLPPQVVDAQSIPPAQSSSSGTTPPLNISPTVQEPSQAASHANNNSDKNTPEMSSSDVPATFKVNVKLVVVRVVARDSQGLAIGNLQQQDFQVFDNGKPQTITQFSVEKAGARVTIEPSGSAPANPPSSPNDSENLAPKPPAENPDAVVPQRYAAYLFDDVHLKFADLVMVRQAAERHLASLHPSDRAAIFSTSGQTVLDFTDDRAKLRDTLLALRPHPVSGTVGLNPCPDVSYYMADLILNKNDSAALQTATFDALYCQFGNDAEQLTAAQQLAQNTARQSIEEGEQESRLALGVLRDLVRRLALMPGQRSIVLVSPGFETPQLEHEYVDVIDKALRSEVIVNAIDARGLYVPGATSDASKGSSSNATGARIRTGFSTSAPVPGGGVMVQEQKALYDNASASADADVLAVLADGTGGTFFHNSNDLYAGFTRVAAPPEFSYVLAFAPKDLKPDGSFHTLKVKLNNPLKLNLQARRGYYAPKHLDDPAEEAKQEIAEAVFSQDESHGLPVELRTQFFKSSDTDARLSVFARVDVKHIRFRKVDGRNKNDLTVVSALFDRNGNYLKGEEKVLQMNWKDETLQSQLASGVTIKSSFDVKPGKYRVRLIVRDAEGQSITAANSAVEIP
jgi:VWFA-related protein